MAVSQLVAVDDPPTGRRDPGRRLLARVRTTPGRLSVTLIFLLVLGLATGLTAWLALQRRAELVHDMTVRSSPLGLSALDIYRSLSDADATVAGTFLAGSSEGPALRARYLDDIARAADAITVAASNATVGSAASVELAQLNVQLPVYTGLVETARAINRQGFPLGAAYLREASWLMRGTLLPAAQRLYDSEKVRLTAAQREAGAFPWTAAGLAGLTVVALLATQIRLSRTTHRVFNHGLVLATVAGFVCLAWTALTSVAVAGHLQAGRRQGSEQVQLLAEARIAGLQARADETLALVARGSGPDLEADYKNAMDRLNSLLLQAGDNAPDPALNRAVNTIRDNVRTWQDSHRKLRALDDGGQYLEAVKLATGTGRDGIPAAFATVDDALTKEIGERNGRFEREAFAAERNIRYWAPMTGVPIFLLVIGVALGLQRRIAEYR